MPAGVRARLCLMKYLKTTILLITAAFFLSSARAQTVSDTGKPVTGDAELSGKVLDEQQKDFPFSTVSLLSVKDSALVKGTLSAENGSFTFSGLKPGSYLVSVYVVGYKKLLKGPFTLTAGNKKHIGTLQMLVEAQQLKGVEVVKKKPLIERQIDKTVVNVEKSALAAGNSALEILARAPGVTVDKDGKISLRGKQGVNIMLDGKPAYLSAEQLANLLRSTEGNAVQSIELITNPSAKYDAAGNSGIINIKLKKNRSYGTNGSVLAGGGYGAYYKFNGGLSLNHRQKKFNVFGNLDYGENKRFGGTDIERVNGTATDPTYFDQTNFSRRMRKNGNYKAGIDYFISDKHTLGFTANGYNSHGHTDSKVLTLIGSAPGRRDSSVVASNPNGYRYTGNSFNMNYKGTLDTLGQEISADAEYADHVGREDNNFNNQYLDVTGQQLKPPYLFRNLAKTTTRIRAAKIDYVYPLQKDMKMEAGLKTSFVKTNNDFYFENFDNGNWINDLRRSNQFLYDESINAAYINVNRKFGKTSVQLGLRAEQTNSKGNSVTEQKVADRHYLNLFPSVFLNQELGKKHEMGFSYSRRVDRPNYESLNPFIYYLDLYSYRFGNPFLKPQYTNSFELSYSFKKELHMSVGYSHTTDVMSDVLLTDTATKTIFISNQNLATQDSYNLNVNYPLQITSWWNSSNNLNTYYNKFSTPDLLGTPYKSGKLAASFNTTHTFTFKHDLGAELSGWYNSRQVYGTLLIDPQYSIDLGLSKGLMNKQLNIKLAANDIFKLQKSRIRSALPSQNYLIKERWESRVFRMTLTYRFGSNEIKAARERSGSADAEGRRVKSGG